MEFRDAIEHLSGVRRHIHATRHLHIAPLAVRALQHYCEEALSARVLHRRKAVAGEELDTAPASGCYAVEVARDRTAVRRPCRNLGRRQRRRWLRSRGPSRQGATHSSSRAHGANFALGLDHGVGRHARVWRPKKAVLHGKLHTLLASRRLSQVMADGVATLGHLCWRRAGRGQDCRHRCTTTGTSSLFLLAIFLVLHVLRSLWQRCGRTSYALVQATPQPLLRGPCSRLCRCTRGGSFAHSPGFLHGYCKVVRDTGPAHSLGELAMAEHGVAIVVGGEEEAHLLCCEAHLR
mmetsp:Transcript_47632/g.101908  ORF Transcript_47632/g.101908 Transcript_47632/m.101908 type:complete len:292 (-) Transcript_47632:1091-1966(-)